MNFTYKQIWLINFPVMMSILIEQLINITDAIFLGHYGEVELGASALAGMCYLAIYMLGFGFSLGLQVMVGRRNGERNYHETGKVFFQGLSFLLVLAGSMFLLSWFFSPKLLSRLITSEEVYEAVLKYLDWRIFGLLFTFPALALRAFFVGITKTRILTTGAIVMVTTNILLNYLLIFGNLGFPRLGISGAALASTISELSFLVVLVVHVYRKVDKRRYGLKPVCEWPLLIRLLRLSIWSMMHSFTGVAPWFLFFVMIEHLGEAQLAIANIVRSISTVFFVIVCSFSTTTGSLVSNLIGAGEYKKIMPLCRKMMGLSFLLGIPLIMLTLFFSDEVLGIYTRNQELIRDAFGPFVVMLSNYFLSVPAHIYCNAVTGTGRTRTAFVFELITIVLYLLYLFLIVVRFDAPLVIYWTAELLYVFVLFVLSYWYMKVRYFKRYLPLV
ncbi:MAG: MATE family efflux transporter [Parabacteroides gordonii]|uniref:MATE family efflux transporter n=1 Tax=Parabacteroides gordonii TaxID=574930 RepID=UPI003A8A11FC